MATDPRRLHPTLAALVAIAACVPGADLYEVADSGAPLHDAGWQQDRSGAPDRTTSSDSAAGVDLSASDRMLATPDSAARDYGGVHLPDSAAPDITVPDSAVPDASSPDTLPAVCLEPRKAGGASLLVVNGTRTPTLVPLSTAQRLAAVGFYTNSVGYYCSGTLISRDYVLTAKHCTQQAAATTVTVVFSVDGSTVSWQCGGVRFYTHPSADIALLEINADPVSQIGAEPVYINPLALDSTWVGVRVEAAGWGSTAADNTGYMGRFFVAEPIDYVGATELVVNGAGLSGLCFGDSGGPVFGIVGDGAVRTLGALSWGDESCVGRDHYVRADAYRTWIEGYTGETPPVETSACGDVTYVGYCDGNNTRAVYCDADELFSVACQEPTPVCGWSTAAQGYRCITTALDPCLGLDALGTCDGDTVRWCASGEIRTFDCAQCGWACGWVSDAIGYDCLD